MGYHHRGSRFSSGCLLRSFNYSSRGHSGWWELNLRALEQCFSNWVFEFFFWGFFPHRIWNSFLPKGQLWMGVCGSGGGMGRKRFKFWSTSCRLKGARIRLGSVLRNLVVLYFSSRLSELCVCSSELGVIFLRRSFVFFIGALSALSLSPN